LSYCKAVRATFIWALAAALGTCAFQDIVYSSVKAEPAPDDGAQARGGEPSLQGSVSQTLPGEWAGDWRGPVRLKQERLKGGVDSSRLDGKTNKNQLDGNADTNPPSEAPVLINLQLETAKMGSQVFNLRVEQLSGGTDTEQSRHSTNRNSKQQEPEPDIIFWHDANQGHLLVQNGASIVIHGNGNGTIGSTPGSAANPNQNAGSPSANTPGPKAGPRNDSAPAPSGTGRDGISYNNGGIVFGGQTEFRGHYFKADDQLAINDRTTVKTDRLDIDGTTRYPAGVPVQLRGSHESGYLINSLRGDCLDPKSNPVIESGPASPVELLGANTKVLRSEVIAVSAGVFDQKSVSALIGKNGVTSGYQQTLIRYTALSPERMFVQGSITNYRLDWSLDKEFSASGYLERHQTRGRN
jgi:hypothetical protein